MKKAVGEKRKAYVLVSTRSEGNEFLTLQPVRDALQVAKTCALNERSQVHLREYAEACLKTL